MSVLLCALMCLTSVMLYAYFIFAFSSKICLFVGYIIFIK